MAYSKEQKDDMFDKVIQYITNGMSLTKALKQEDVFSKIVWLELLEEEDKQTRYERAREERADAIFEEIKDIADNTGDDMITLESGKEVVNHEVVARDRLRVDARKWMLSKMLPKKYGDKQAIEHSGEVKGTEPQINLVVDGKKMNLKE